MSELTTECLEKFVNDIKADGMCDITDHQVELALIRLLAYERAAKNEVPLPEALKYAEIYGRAFICVDRSGSVHVVDPSQITLTILNEPAPALPKQPELLSIGELLHRLEEQTGEKWVEESAQPVIPEQTERERIRREHAEWSDATFGNVGPVGPLKHLSKEALEAAADPSDPLEWADMQFLLWDAQRRMGISDEFITRAMIEKLEINKSRQWPEPKDGEPRLHVKQPQNAQQNIPENIPAQPVSNPYKFLDERAKYRVIIEGFSNSRSVDFEACSQEEAEEIGRDIFHEECNYGVERLESIPAQDSE